MSWISSAISTWTDLLVSICGNSVLDLATSWHYVSTSESHTSVSDWGCGYVLESLSLSLLLSNFSTRFILHHRQRIVFASLAFNHTFMVFIGEWFSWLSWRQFHCYTLALKGTALITEPRPKSSCYLEPDYFLDYIRFLCHECKVKKHVNVCFRYLSWSSAASQIFTN